ncbi:hypothetical protein [Paraburkholderia sp. GAS42]|jgi:hypothetical protein|uniref:hypothetical protein n=1 Tax=Paraburkholderia sp. GAS42 TaxID=3035135 RepID=UPI003D1C2232
MQAYVHNPKGQMPIFSEKILSDDDSGIMPKLFPKPLNADDVRDVARYVASFSARMPPGKISGDRGSLAPALKMSAQNAQNRAEMLYDGRHEKAVNQPENRQS